MHIEITAPTATPMHTMSTQLGITHGIIAVTSSFQREAPAVFVIKDKQVNLILEQSNKGLLQPITKTANANANAIGIDNVNTDSLLQGDIYAQTVAWFIIFTQLKHCDDQLWCSI